MTSWFRRKRGDVRHAVQELRAGDAIDRERCTVRTTIVGGRPPGDDARIPVPMGIERVLRKAASDPRFETRLLDDRESALATSALRLTPSEHAILIATPAEQLSAMVEQIRPTLSHRRGFFKRLAAAAGIALFGAQMMGCKGKEPKEGRLAPKSPGISMARPEPEEEGMAHRSPGCTKGLPREPGAPGETKVAPHPQPTRTRGVSPGEVEPKDETGS